MEKFCGTAKRMGIRGSPDCAANTMAKAYSERLIGSIRRECLNHILVSTTYMNCDSYVLLHRYLNVCSL
jgi:hypothetical protein